MLFSISNLKMSIPTPPRSMFRIYFLMLMLRAQKQDVLGKVSFEEVFERLPVKEL